MRHIRKHFKRKLRHKIRKLREYKFVKGAHYQKGHFKHFSRKRGYGNISQCPPPSPIPTPLLYVISTLSYSFHF